VRVRQEAGPDQLDVAHATGRQLRLQPLQHDRRHVDRDDAIADARDREAELAGPRPELDHERGARESELLEQRHLVGRGRVLLGVVSGDVRGVQVLPTGAGDLVDEPRRHGGIVPRHQARKLQPCEMVIARQLADGRMVETPESCKRG